MSNSDTRSSNRTLIASVFVVCAIGFPFILKLLPLREDWIVIRGIYDILVPCVPFLVLAALALLRRKDGNWRFLESSLTGAALAAVISILTPRILILYSVAHHQGGGANIGLALLQAALPIWLPFAMRVGGELGTVGKRVRSEKSTVGKRGL